VEVELTRRDSLAEVVVRDNGEGIDPGFIPHVFDRFKQADASTTRRHGGPGIGLSIVASLVEAHGGSVRAESAGAGKGATFTVTLPLLEQSSSLSPTTVRISGAATSLAGHRIVVVDDDAATRRIMMTALEAAGAEVRECSTAGEAFLAVSEWRPDVLVSDLAMPNEDGYSLLLRLRERGHAVPALALTACVRPEDEARVREAGFHRHVAKPFDPEELVSAVAGVGRAPGSPPGR
jgi:CheY-like chemotaxis protein